MDVAENGKIGLEKVRQKPYDLIFSDIMMPEMNGLDFLTELKKDPATRDIPVVVLTNLLSAGREEQLRAQKLGALKCMLKSEHDPLEIVEEARTVLRLKGTSQT